MTESWLSAAEWGGRSALIGATALLIGWVLARLARSASLKRSIAAWSVRAAVLAPILCLFPTWLTITVPVPAGVEPVREVRADPDAGPWESDWRDEVVFPPLPDEQFTGAVWDSPPADEPASPEAEAAPAAVAGPAAATASPAEPAPVAGPSASIVESVAPLVLIAYGAVAAALLALLVVGQIGLLRLRRAGAPAPQRMRELLDRLVAGPHRPDLLLSDRVESPVCFGFLRPTILLPRRLATSATESQLRWVLAHELEHLRRGDPLTGWWVGVARALYFFVPWFWPLRRELALAQEYLADAAAAAADGRVVDYAEFLVDLSGGKARLPRAAFAVRAGSSDLFRRVTMLLSSQAGSNRPTRGWAALAAGGVLSATVLLSGLGLAADDPKPKPKKVVVVTDDDAKPGDRSETRVIKVKPDGEKPQAGEKPKPRDGDKPKAGPRDGEQKKPGARDQEKPRPERRRIEVRDMGPEIAELKQAILEAARAGNEEDLRKALDRLEKLLAAGQLRVFGPEGFRVPPIPPVPGLPPAPPLPRFDRGQMERAQQEMERAQKAFADAIEKLKDNPEAQEALKKAQGEYRKALDLARDKMREAFKDKEKVEGFRRFGGEGGFAPGAPGGPRFGVAVAPVSEAMAEQLDLKGFGVVVQSVVPGSPAEKAGLRKNDVIVSFAGRSVAGDTFVDEVARTKPGEKVDVVIVRKGKRETLKGIELARPEARRTEPRKPVEVRPGEFRFRGRDGEPGKTRFEKTSINVSDDSFQIDASRDELHYRVTGSMVGGKPQPESITVAEDGKKKEYKSLDQVPEEHRAAVKQLLGNIGGAR